MRGCSAARAGPGAPRRPSRAAAAVARPDLHRFGDVAVDLAHPRGHPRRRAGQAHPPRVRAPGASSSSNPREVFTREQLLREVWAIGSGSRRTVDNFVAQLRAKLEHDPEAPRHLVTVRGTGYRFDP